MIVRAHADATHRAPRDDTPGTGRDTPGGGD